ncbi:T9SS type A sorting domain-containing protein [Sungkyunkwania multivorans]|uniref:T9SS type A sorting domain-containing protein n=1 Tax=Sungkyunkwania multivorans TaxID=1173618 RepID=A0ABW3CTF8_9FLAO
MKRNYFLVLITLMVSTLSFGQIWTEDFESYTNNTGIQGPGVTNSGDYPAGVTKWTLDATNANMTATSDWAWTETGVFSFRDTDGTGGVIWESESIDISGATGPVTFQLTASNNAGGFEPLDFYDVSYSIDGSPFTLIQNWNGLGDATHTILGESGGADWNTVETIQQAGITGSTLQIRVQVLVNAGAEQFFLDDISVFEGTPPPSITITNPADMTVFAPGTTNVNLEYVTANLVGGETVNVTVNGNTTNGVSSPFPIATADGQTYNVTADLLDSGSMVVDTQSISFSVASATAAANIAAVRAGAIDQYFTLTNEVFVNFVAGNSRNQIFIADASGAILIDDPSGVITTTYNTGDGITGLTGQLSQFGNIFQFRPSQDPGAATTTGNPLVTVSATILDILNNFNNYDSSLVEIADVTFADAGMTFANSTNYSISDPSARAATTLRTQFAAAGLDGQTIPTGPTPIRVLVGEFSGTPQVYPASVGGILSNESFDAGELRIYPIPAKQYVNIFTTRGLDVQVQVYSILGKKVLESSIADNRLNIGSLATGIYILRVTEENKTATRKLIVE